ncbi:MAG: elongation factor P 5-aminopentanone reductase [Enterococcus sp.]
MPSALVMGASGDIGMAVCRKLAADGWSLYCHYNTQEEKVLKFVLEMRESYPHQDFFVVSLNMLDTSGISGFLTTLFQVDSVIFAAGFTRYALFSEQDEADIDQLWQIHVKTPLILLQKLENKLSQSPYGRIVFIGSVYGMQGSSMETIYSTVKGAQQAFAKAYSKEIATLGITVNVVAPGAVATSMNQEWSEEEILDLKRQIPLGRLAQPKEIAAAVSFLLQKDAAYITGTTLPVSGGWLE